MSKCSEQAAAVVVMIQSEQADIHTTAPISSSYNQTLALGGPVKPACLSLGPAVQAHRCCRRLAGRLNVPPLALKARSF